MGKVMNNKSAIDYIKNAIKNHKTYAQISRELNISDQVIRHICISNMRFCVVCGIRIVKGRYCSNPDCHKIRNRTYNQAYWIKQHKEGSNIRKNSRPKPKKELVCSNCGRSFLRGVGYINGQPKPKTKDKSETYCSRDCFDNRAKSARTVRQKIKNIEILSGFIEKEKPIEPIISIGHEMRKAPESEEHMK